MIDYPKIFNDVMTSITTAEEQEGLPAKNIKGKPYYINIFALISPTFCLP